MNKIFPIIAFLFLLPIQAKDTFIGFEKQNARIDTAFIEHASFPKGFKKKYSGSDFTYEFKTSEKNAWDRFMEWLASFFRNMFHFTSDQSAIHAVAIFIKIVAVLIIIFVIYLIVKAVLNKDGQWIFGKSSDRKTIRYDEVEKNLRIADFEKLIGSALESGENRLAIRYYYLWLLRKMSDNHLIEWDIEKTNSDYLHELQNQSLKDRFAYLSYLYEYIWYGEFEFDDNTFTKAKTAFEKAIKSVGNE